MEAHLNKAKLLRNDPQVHYNCAQGVLMTFAQDCGLTEEQMHSLGAHFGAGMKCGEMCGAITGGLMVIGLLQGGDEEYRAFLSAMKEKHAGRVRCAELLREEVHSPAEKKPHCDDMVYEAVEAVCDVMRLS